MMLILKEGEIYFFDRDHSCFKVSDLRFPQRKDLSNHIKDTLLDGVSCTIFEIFNAKFAVLCWNRGVHLLFCYFLRKW